MNILEAHGRFIAAGPDADLMEIDPEWFYAVYCTAFAAFSALFSLYKQTVNTPDRDDACMIVLRFLKADL